jgi:hypothetical protein
MYVKHCLETKEIIFYKRYVYDILIIYDQNRTNEDTIHNMVNSIDKQLEFKITTDDNKTIRFFDLSINRNVNNIDLDIYRKPTYMDITIHFTSIIIRMIIK